VVHKIFDDPFFEKAFIAGREGGYNLFFEIRQISDVMNQIPLSSGEWKGR